MGEDGRPSNLLLCLFHTHTRRCKTYRKLIEMNEQKICRLNFSFSNRFGFNEIFSRSKKIIKIIMLFYFKRECSVNQKLRRSHGNAFTIKKKKDYFMTNDRIDFPLQYFYNHSIRKFFNFFFSLLFKYFCFCFFRKKRRKRFRSEPNSFVNCLFTLRFVVFCINKRRQS